MGISGGRRREGYRLHRVSRLRRRHRRGAIHLRHRCCAGRCHHPSCGLGRERSCGPGVCRSESARSTSAAMGSSNAVTNTNAIENRSSGRCRFRSRGRIQPKCSRDLRRWPSWKSRPKEDGRCECARCLLRRCWCDCCRSLAGRYRDRRYCLALPRFGRYLRRGCWLRDCSRSAGGSVRAASGASCYRFEVERREHCNCRSYVRRPSYRSCAARADAKQPPLDWCAP
jgi:hypothetical protein